MSEAEKSILVVRMNWAIEQHEKGNDVPLFFLVQQRNDILAREEQFERLAAENERLKAIVDMIEIKRERDDLAGRVAEIAEAIDVAKTDTGDECRAVLAAIEKVCWRASSTASGDRTEQAP
jgi:hypothetical protein